MMKRKDKYPETASFIYHNQNPKNKITADCVIRAVSLALDQDYNETIKEMCNLMIKTGYAYNDDKGIDAYLKEKHWIKNKQLRHEDNTKYTGDQFATWLSLNFPRGEIGNVFCNIGSHHVVCFKPTFHGEGRVLFPIEQQLFLVPTS